MSTIDKGTRVDMLPYSLSMVSFQMEKETKIQDPYMTGVELKERDIGVYKGLCVVDAKTIDLKRRKNALFLLHKLKYVSVLWPIFTAVFLPLASVFTWLIMHVGFSWESSLELS